MRVVIAGAGRAGISVAIHLLSAGHDVVVVDQDATIIEQAFEHHGLVALVGDGTDMAVLDEAEVGRADVLVALLRCDADNLAVAMLAKAAGARRVMVRMRDPAYRPLYAAAGVSRVLSEIDVFVGALSTAIEHDAVSHAMVLGAGGSIAFEISVPKGAVVDGKSVSDLASAPGFPASCVLAALGDPAGAVSAPRGGSVVTAGMRLLLVAHRADLSAAVAFFTRVAEQPTG